MWLGPLGQNRLHAISQRLLYVNSKYEHSNNCITSSCWTRKKAKHKQNKYRMCSQVPISIIFVTGLLKINWASILARRKQNLEFLVHKKVKNVDTLDIKWGDINIKQYTSVTYLGCELDQYLSGESMVTKVLGKINGRLKFLYRKQKFLSSSLRRMLCNSLIQPHCEYACSAWYLNFTKKYKNKVQVAQNICMRFCLFLENRAHLG